MFISTAYAQTAPAAAAGGTDSLLGQLGGLLPLVLMFVVLMFVVLYFIMIRPQGHRKFKGPGQRPRRAFDGLRRLDLAPVPSPRAVLAGPCTAHQGRWRSSPQG